MDKVSFGIKIPPVSDEGYQSPVSLIEGYTNQIIEEKENLIMGRIEEQIGVKVDKDELIKALKYDRNQYAQGYTKGWFDGVEEGKQFALKRMAEFLEEE